MENISVIIPTFNRARLLRRAIQSVIDATDPGDEIIVVDDGSTDETPSVPAEFKREVRYLVINHAGAGGARNLGIKAASHDLIAFADSDDEWLPERLNQQRPLMETRCDLVFSFTNFGQLFEDGRVELDWAKEWHFDLRPWDEILGRGELFSAITPCPEGVADVPVHIGSMYLRELHANYINVNTLLVRRSVAGEAFQFAEKFPTFEDWECFSRISRVGPCAYIAVNTALQRAHSGARLTDADSMTTLTTRLALIRRTWAADPEFVRDHGGELKAVMRQLQRTLIKVYIHKGQFEQARTVAAELEGNTFETVLVMLPSPLLRQAMNAYNTSKRWAGIG